MFQVSSWSRQSDDTCSPRLDALSFIAYQFTRDKREE
jgi:hypothetical protein